MISLWFFTQLMQQDVQGCLTSQARAECSISLLSTGVRMAESSSSLNSDIQTQPRGPAGFLTALNVNFVVTKWSPKSQLSLETLPQEAEFYLSCSSAALTWV